MSRAALVAAMLAGALCAPTPCFAQAEDGRVSVSPAVSSSAMRRDVALITAAGQIAHRLTELGLVRMVPALEDSGGSEAAFVHESLVADRIYGAGRTHYFDWIQFIHAKLDTIAYSLGDLSASNFADERAVLGAAAPGDPTRFAVEYERQRLGGLPGIDAIRDRASSLRRSAATSLLDLTLASAFVHTARYLATGDRGGEPLRIRAGGVDFVPALHFTFTPVGYEHRGSVRALTGSGQAVTYVRRITSPIGDHLNGAGGSWSWRPGETLRAAVRADVWRTRADGYGYRIEIGGEKVFAPGRSPLTVGASVGYNVRGVLEGYAPGSGPILGLSGGFRF